jgi:hypothetical protein
LSLITCQLVLNPSKRDAAKAKGLEDIANLLSRCLVRQTIYRLRYKENAQPIFKEDITSTHREYKDDIKALYVKVLTFQTTIIVFLLDNRIKRISADIIIWNDWDSGAKEVKDQEGILQEFEKLREYVWFQEECNRKQQQHAQRIEALDAIKKEVSRLSSKVSQAQNDNKRRSLLNWLSSIDPSENYRLQRRRHKPSTSNWLIQEGGSFRTWKQTPNSFL